MVAKNSSVPIQNDHIPVRFNIGVMLFLASLVTCMIKVNISVNLLAMVLPTTGNTTGTEPARPSVRNSQKLCATFGVKVYFIFSMDHNTHGVIIYKR